jgi:hypothetical protein
MQLVSSHLHTHEPRNVNSCWQIALRYGMIGGQTQARRGASYAAHPFIEESEKTEEARELIARAECSGAPDPRVEAAYAAMRKRR